MCGAFSLHFPVSVIYDRFTVGGRGSFAPRYNARPSQILPIILNTKPDKLTPAFWGLTLDWGDKSHFVINTRKESLEKPYAFDSLKHRRCLIPADGFYEWQKTGGTKTPYRFQLRTKKLLCPCSEPS